MRINIFENLSYQCGDIYCTSNKQKCNVFKLVLRFNYDTMIDIKYCSRERGLKLRDVCVLTKNCLNSETKTNKNKSKKLKKQIECPCPMSHKYKCNAVTGFCTKDRFTCNQIQKLNTFSRKNINPKTCLTNKQYMNILLQLSERIKNLTNNTF
jgi:hypothetical protein